MTSLDARLASALGSGYEVRRLIGRGGFAEVYTAFDTQLKRDVAVKVLRPEIATAVTRERFRREAEGVARVRHPHIVPIYAVGEAGDLAWYVMPMITGESLRARLDREGRLPVPLARRILTESVDALAAAHRAGLVHRDIKPDNVLLDGEDARVLVADFGIAKALTADEAGLTGTGVVIGTPHYMSPEQASGEPVDARSDLYSLGVVAYEMLAGEVPFGGATVAAVLLKQVAEAAPTVTRRRPDCPPDLAMVIARCLAKQPEQRWASAEDLLRALTTAAAETRAARRSGGAPLFGVANPLRRFRALVLAAGAVVALCAALDFVRGTVLTAPLAAMIGAFVIAAQYGRLWTAGYDWRDVLARPSAKGGNPSPVSMDSAEFGEHYAAIQQARVDRAAMRAAAERAPKVERRFLADVLPAVDALVARAADVARHLYALERQVEPGPVEIERRLAATRAEAPSPGRDQRLALLERRREAVRALAVQRDAAARLLGDHLAAIGRLRAEVERAAGTGPAGAQAMVGAALRDVEARLQSADLAPRGKGRAGADK